MRFSFACCNVIRAVILSKIELHKKVYRRKIVCRLRLNMYMFVFIKSLAFCPVDTMREIYHRFNVKIPHGKFVEISSILKGESTWKLWHRFDVESSTWTRLSKWTKYWRVFHVDFSMSFRCRIDVTSVLAVFFLLCPNIFCSGNLF